MTRRLTPYALLGVLLGLALVPLLGTSPAYAARTITISLTADGPKPASVTAAVGDTIQFKNTDATFVHEVGSRSTNWPRPGGTFDSGPLAPQQTYVVGKLLKAGTYTYEGRNLDSFVGNVVVPAAASPAPSPRPSAAPKPTPTASPAPARSPSPAASPSPTGGSGAVGPPPLAGGVIPPPSPPGGGVPAPNVAPTLAGEQVPSAQPSGGTVAIGHGRLPEPPTGRRYGLPAVLAAVGAVGVASLLVRLLLAHPAARA